MSQYMALSVAILTQQHKDFDRITARIIEGAGGLQRLFKHGMELYCRVSRIYQAIQGATERITTKSERIEPMFAVIDQELGRVDVADCFMCSENTEGEAVFIEEGMP